MTLPAESVPLLRIVPIAYPVPPPEMEVTEEAPAMSLTSPPLPVAEPLALIWAVEGNVMVPAPEPVPPKAIRSMKPPSPPLLEELIAAVAPPVLRSIFPPVAVPPVMVSVPAPSDVKSAPATRSILPALPEPAVERLTPGEALVRFPFARRTRF